MDSAKRPYHFMTDSEKQRIVELRQGQYGLARIAAETGVALPTVSRYLRQLRIGPAMRGRPSRRSRG